MPTENKIAEPLKVERSTVTKLVITGAPRLDSITVFLEDFGRRDCPIESNPNYQTAQGKITINCWDNSWNAYWGGMGTRTVAEFVADCDWHYVLNCLDRGISDTQFTGDALEALARKCILERRRGRNKSDWEEGSLNAEDARRLLIASTNFATSNPQTSAGTRASCSQNCSAKSGTTPSAIEPKRKTTSSRTCAESSKRCR